MNNHTKMPLLLGTLFISVSVPGYSQGGNEERNPAADQDLDRTTQLRNYRARQRLDSWSPAQ